MTDSNALEPSMEEILASIRRIMSDDDAQVAGAADDDILLLTERAPEPEPSVDHTQLVARETALSAAASFQKLSYVVESEAAARVPARAASPTLEDVTRDLMRPMLKAWLDENLEAIVRARVDEEVERITSGRVR